MPVLHGRKNASKTKDCPMGRLLRFRRWHQFKEQNKKKEAPDAPKIATKRIDGRRATGLYDRLDDEFRQSSVID